MVKPDIKRNYYADLELPSDASIEDIKKSYRKLALKYHPDRNPGKEAEFSLKFQVIQAAHEILHEPTSKARYDADRKRAGLVGGTFSKPNVPPRSNATNPMYQATSAYPPPPRRTPNPTSWRSTTSGTSGADRFTNFPKPAPTSKKETPDRANVFNAWQNMKSQPQPTPKNPSPQRPRPPPPNPPPRRDTKFPTEEDIRAGMNYRQAPAGGNAGFRSAWAEYNATNTAKAQTPPNLGRSNTTRSRRAGFDPKSTGDEGPAASTANYSSSRRKSADPPYFVPPPQPFQQKDDSDAPYTEGTRIKTPYSSHIGQQTYSSSEDARRAASTSHAHAASDPSIPRSSPPRRTGGTGTARKPFVVYSSSDDSDTEDESTTASDNAQASGQPSAGDKSDNPFLRSFTRPKKTPNPPSRQYKNGFPPKAPTEASGTSQAGVGVGVGVGAGLTSETTEQDKPSMYATSFSFTPPAHAQQAPSPTWPFGADYQRHKSPDCIPTWAYPSTVRPAAKRNLSAAQRAWHEYASSTSPKCLRRSQPLSQDSGGVPILENEADDASSLQQPQKKPSFTKEDAAGLYSYITRSWSRYNADKRTTSFSIPVSPDTFSANKVKSRSEDNINTAFAPSEWAGAFTSNNVFAAAQTTTATGRRSATPSRKGSRAFRPQPSVYTSQEAVPQQTSTDDAQQNPTASPSAQPVKYSAEEWKKTFKDPSWVFDPEALRSTSPGKSDTRTASRSNSAARKGQRVANKLPVTTPKPATVADQAEEEAAQVPSETPVAPEDAMDVDDTPPAANPVPQRPQGPRVYPVDTAQLRRNASNQDQPATPSGQINTTNTSLNTKLDDLANVAPFTNTATSEGLEGLNDISSTLPFASKASTTSPIKPYTPQTLQLPSLPRSPPTPTNLTKISWTEYCELFSLYLEKFDRFNKSLLDHFTSRQLRATEMIKSGVKALEAVGEGTAGLGFLSYAQGVKEDERVREHWNLGCEKHADAVKEFEGVRERVRVLSEGVGLKDA